jgi:hypothetical protein
MSAKRTHADVPLLPVSQRDGHLRLEMTPEGFQLDSFVLEYRDNLEVHEPAWFREEIARQVTRIGALYGLRLVLAGEATGRRTRARGHCEQKRPPRMA